MCKHYFVALFFFLLTPLFSQEFVVPPELYWLTHQIDELTPSNPIEKSDGGVEIFEASPEKRSVKGYVLPVFVHWNFSGTRGVCANTNYSAVKKGDKWVLKSIVEDDPVFGMFIFDNNYNLIFEQPYGMSYWLMDAYWLTDSKVVAIGVYPSLNSDVERAVIFFYVYEIEGTKIKRTSYEYKKHIEYSEFNKLKMWSDLRPDYFW